jgi:thiol:disulfide interchange protein DsbC
MFKRWSAAAVLALFCIHAVADDADKAVNDALAKIFVSTKPTQVIKSELPGFHQAIVGGQVFFVSDDGKYIVRGNVFDIATKTDIGEKQLAALRKDALAKIPADKQIVFAPPNPKYTVTVFTDVDCPYCRQFHKQIAEYNKLGIAVNYVLFPLAIHPGADKKAETVWCSQNRNTAYTTAMNGAWDLRKAVSSAPAAPADAKSKTDPAAAKADPASGYKPLTCSNPIAELTEIGKSMGVDGTPAIFDADGDHIAGYMPPDKLAARLEQLSQRDHPLTAK